MGETGTKSIVDAVLDRRAAFEQRELLASGKLQRHIEEARKEILSELRLLRKQTDPVTGALLKNEGVERALRGELAEMNVIWKRNMDAAANSLLQQRTIGFRQGAADVSFAVQEATGGELSISFNQVFEEAATVSANASVLGVKTANAMRGIQADMNRRTRDALTKGFLRGESIDKIAKRITQATDIGKRAAVRVARTNLNASINEASRMIYDADPIFSGYQWDAVMDTKTSFICAALHGRIYKKGSTPPGPPAHPNCRSVLLPVFADPDVQKFADEGGRRVRKFDRDGEIIGTEVIDSNKSFDAWLRSQNKATTEQFFGNREVAERLFRAGKINSQDFVGADLMPRSDNTLIQRAWSRRPGDAALKALAKERGLKFRSSKSFKRADGRLQGSVSHTIGTRRGQPRLEKARIERLDKLKVRRTRDVVRAAAKRQGADDILRQRLPQDLAKQLLDEIEPLDDQAERLEAKIKTSRDQQATLLKARGRLALNTPQMQKLEAQVQKDIAKLKKTRGSKENKIAKLLNIKKHDTFKLDVFAESDAQERRVEKVLRQMEKFVAKKGKALKVDVFVTTRKDYRGSVDPKSRTMTLGTGARRDVIFHEVGHILELSRPEVKRAAKRFLARRTRGELAQRLSKLTGDRGYHKSEVSKPDRFFNVYVGKIYKGGRATEVVSMGIEALFNNPVRFAKVDPEHFNLIINILRGAL